MLINVNIGRFFLQVFLRSNCHLLSPVDLKILEDTCFMFEGLLEVSIPAIYITCTEREMIRRIQQRARPAERNLRQGDQKTFPTLRDVSLSLASNTPSTSREEWIVTQFSTTSISSTPRTFPRSEWPRKFWSGIVYFIDPRFPCKYISS